MVVYISSGNLLECAHMLMCVPLVVWVVCATIEMVYDPNLSYIDVLYVVLISSPLFTKTITQRFTVRMQYLVTALIYSVFTLLVIVFWVILLNINTRSLIGLIVSEVVILFHITHQMHLMILINDTQQRYSDVYHQDTTTTDERLSDRSSVLPLLISDTSCSECPVCFESTSHALRECLHPICVDCCHRITNIVENEMSAQCPMCRRKSGVSIDPGVSSV